MVQAYYPGDKVELFYGFALVAVSSIYEIVRRLPTRQYQVRGPEGYDRVIGEGQIRSRVHAADRQPDSSERDVVGRNRAVTVNPLWRQTLASEVSLAGLARQRWTV
jgi:hypothetical protein